MKGVTDLQYQAYVVIHDYIKANGYAPTGNEVSFALGTHYNNAQKTISALVAKGYLASTRRGGWRSLQLTENTPQPPQSLETTRKHHDYQRITKRRYCIECGKQTARGVYFCSDKCRLAPPKARARGAAA